MPIIYFFPTITLTQLSPDIFTTVLHISKGRSTAKTMVRSVIRYPLSVIRYL